MRRSLLGFALLGLLSACADGGGSSQATDGGIDVPANVCGTPGRLCNCLRTGFTGYELCVLGAPTCVCSYPDGSVDETVAADVPAPPTDSAPADAASSDAAVSCTRTGSTFPTFDSRCTAGSECVAVGHQTDCCGNSRMVGIRVGERAAFDAAEGACRTMFPACDCPVMSPLTDDGARAPTLARVGVRCDSGRCATYVAP